MILITWNVQWCRGVDGRVDAARIVASCRAMGDFDVLCLQEVARSFPGLAGSLGEDQVDALARLLPGFAPVPGMAVDTLAPDGTRRQFGNLILSRLPVRQSLRHSLPWPPDPDVPSMPRVAVEAVLETRPGPLRVTTTHLEYYSPRQRTAQVERLRELHAEAAAHAGDTVFPAKEGSPFETLPRPRSCVLTADFNFGPAAPEYSRLQAPIAAGVPAFRDAWSIANPGRAHAPTVGLYDKVQWPGEPFCCDFVFVTEDIASRVEAVSVDSGTQASDHQPVMVRLQE